MSSRDRSDRNRDAGRTTGDGSGNPNANRPASGWEFDPAEINRYLSGGSNRSRGTARPSSGGERRATPGRQTADSLEQLRRARQQAQQGDQAANNPTRARPAQADSESTSTGRPARGASNRSPIDDTSRQTIDTASTARSWPRPATPTESHDDVTGYDAPDWDDSAYVDASEEPLEPAAHAPRLSRPHLTRPQLTVPRPAELPRPAMPAFIKGADLANDATALSLIGIALLSLAVMAILVANRISGVASPFATHVSASGALEHFEKNTAIWRLPLLSAMFFLMNLVAAWFISPTDRFLSRFLLGVSAVVQLVAWIALIHFLW